MAAPPPPAEIRFRTSAYVFFEDPGSASLLARLAAAEVPMAVLWALSLLGFLAAILVAPSVSLPVGIAIGAAEAAVFLAALALSGAWLRGHRTPVITAFDLVLEGTLDRSSVALSDIGRVEIARLSATDPPMSRVSIACRDGGRVHLDLPREEALSLCRVLQQRVFVGGAGARHDAELGTLDRARDPVAAWVARLRERFGKTGYRHAAGIAEDELDRALHDAALPAARRVGAALAICAAGGIAGRERVLRIAERLETSALRIAVERAAAGTLDEEVLAVAEAEDVVLGRGQAGATAG